MKRVRTACGTLNSSLSSQEFAAFLCSAWPQEASYLFDSGVKTSVVSRIREVVRPCHGTYSG